MSEKTNEEDNLHIPGFHTPRITVGHQGAYHLGPAWRRAGSRLRGYFVIELDSLEKRIEVQSCSSSGWDDEHEEDPGTISLHVGPRGNGEHTIFYTDDKSVEAAAIDPYDWSEMQKGYTA